MAHNTRLRATTLQELLTPPPAPLPAPRTPAREKARAGNLRKAFSLHDCVFSFALFKVGRNNETRFGYYLAAAESFIVAMRAEFERCVFVAHVGADVSREQIARLAKAAKGRLVQVYTYSLGNKPGAMWLVGALRFRTLWEWPQSQPVVVCDIHDDPALLVSQLHQLMAQMQAEGQEVVLSYWKATSKASECAQKCALPVPGKLRWHAHTDGGLCVWRPGVAKEKVRAYKLDFMQHIKVCASKPNEIPRGVDEMFVDAYLWGCELFTSLPDSLFLLTPHKHRALEGTDGRAQSKALSRAAVTALLAPQSPNAPKITRVNLPLGEPKPYAQRITVLEVCAEVNDEQRRRRRELSRFFNDHDPYCAVCEGSGQVVCCDACHRVFHVKCVRPRMVEVPKGDWACAHCQSADKGLSKEERARAKAHIRSMKVLGKRSRPVHVAKGTRHASSR